MNLMKGNHRRMSVTGMELMWDYREYL